MSSLDLQNEYFEKVHSFADSTGLLDDPDSVPARTIELWQRTLKAVSAADLSAIDTEIDWVIKLRLLERYMNKHDMDLSNPHRSDGLGVPRHHAHTRAVLPAATQWIGRAGDQRHRGLHREVSPTADDSGETVVNSSKRARRSGVGTSL